MSNTNNLPQIYDKDPDRSGFNSLFSFHNKPTAEQPKPYTQRSLPDSFYHPYPNPKNKNVERQHTKNQLSLPNTSLQPAAMDKYTHSRTVSDSAVPSKQHTTNSSLPLNNSELATLPLPDGWQEKRKSNGQIYYTDQIAKCTTRIDPRPKHYAAFRSYCATLALPDGYDQRCDSQGNIYFVDHIHRQTYWDDPRPHYYRSIMTKRLDRPSPMASQPEEHLLNNKLTAIIKERHALQIRTQELERMEVDIRNKLSQRDNTNNISITDQTTIESFIDDLFGHKRQDSVDSGLDDGQCSNNQAADALGSIDFLDDLLVPNSSDYSAISMDINFPVPNSPLFPAMIDSHSKKKSGK